MDSRANVISEILEQFQIEGTLTNIKKISIGHINKTFQVDLSNQGKTDTYILQSINTQIFKDVKELMNNIKVVANHLEQERYPLKILKPILTKKEDLVFKEGAAYWRLFPFFKNTHTINVVTDPNLAYEVAFAFGEYARYLHRLNFASLVETIPNFHNTPLRYQRLVKAEESAHPSRIKETKEIISQVKKLNYLLDFYVPISKHIRVVHYDTKINNVLLNQITLKRECIIDLDTLMPGMLPYDFGDLVRTSSASVDENEQDLSVVHIIPELLEALTNGYLAGIQEAIHPTEKAHLYHGAALIIYEQSIRFLTDYLEKDRYYPIEYPEQNLKRAENQMTLLIDFLAKIDIG